MAEPTSANRAPSLIIAAGAGLAIGLATGLLLRPVSADWFEAVGTWVGVVVSTTAVLLSAMVACASASDCTWTARTCSPSRGTCRVRRLY